MLSAPAAPSTVRLHAASFAGSERRRGEQHGERFGPAVRESGVLRFFRDHAEHEVLGGPTPLASSALRGLQSLLASRLSPSARELGAGFSRAAGMSEADLARALVMPDVLNTLIGAGARLTGAPALGCTSVAAWGGYTPDGRLLYGRNLDFLGHGYWEANQLAARHRPERGLPYVSLATAGCVLDGITGINAAGLTVDIHQHVNHATDLWSGRPILDLAQQALQHCHTIEEAVEKAAGWPTSSGWSLVLTHWKEKRAAVVERGAGRWAVTRSEGESLAWTNTYRDPALRAGELANPAFRACSDARLARARRLLDEGRGRLTPSRVAALLGDHWDAGTGRWRAFAQCVSQPHNLTSVVIDPENGVLYAAEGPAPACEAGYRKVSLWDDSGPGEALPREASPLSTGQRAGYAAYVSALAAWHVRRDPQAALRALREAAAHDPAEPVHLFMRGLFELKTGEPAAAARVFEAGEALPDLPHRRGLQRLWRRRALDSASGRRRAPAVHPDFYHADARA